MWNRRIKIIILSKPGSEKYPWKSAKVARKLRESWSAQSKTISCTVWSIYSGVSAGASLHPCPLQRKIVIKHFRPGQAIYNEPLVCSLGVGTDWWRWARTRTHLFSQDPPRKLAKEVFARFIPGKYKNGFAKEWRKVLAKDRVIRTKSHRVFSTAQLAFCL